MEVVVGSVRVAHPAPDRRVVLLPEARTVRGPVARGSSAAQTTHAGARPRGARAALSAGFLEGHRSRIAGAGIRRADGAPRRADTGAPVRESRRRISRRRG